MREIRTYSNNASLVHKRRVQIVAAAIKVFLENGYHNSTIRQLARALGMSEGSLYRYISSKEDILHLICLTSVPNLNELKKIANQLSHTNADKSEILRECIKCYFKQVDIFQERNIFFNREINHFSHEDRHLLLQSQTDHIHFFENLIQEGINSGEFKVDSPLLIAHNIVIIGFEWGLRRWFLKKNFTLEEYTKMNTNFILNAILVKKNSP